MSFGEHLEVLRRHVLRCILYLVLGTVICGFFQEELIDVVIWPHKRAMAYVQESRRTTLVRGRLPVESADRVIALLDGLGRLETKQEELVRSGLALTPERFQADLKGYEQRLETLMTEARELEKAYASLSKKEGTTEAERDALEAKRRKHGREVFDLHETIRAQFGTLLPGESPTSGTGLHFLKYQEVFINYLKVTIICALILISPFIFLELWAFVAEGLYEHERRFVRIFAPFSFFNFGAGVAFGYFVLIPLGLQFLGTYGHPDTVTVTITLSEYLSFFFTLTLVVGLIFELPLLMVFLTKLGVATPASLSVYRKYWLLLAVIIAAVLTPPDPVTQVLLAIPMVFLYEIGIIVSRLLGAGKQPMSEERA